MPTAYTTASARTALREVIGRGRETRDFSRAVDAAIREAEKLLDADDGTATRGADVRNG